MTEWRHRTSRKGIAAFLRSVPRIQFTLQWTDGATNRRLSIDSSHFSLLSTAIEDHTIKVAVSDQLAEMGSVAAYQAGTNTFVVSTRPADNVTLVHEAVHAIRDRSGDSAPTTMEEAAAFLAETVYLEGYAGEEGYTLSNVYKAAARVCMKYRLDREGSGALVSLEDSKSIEAAVALVPLYSDRVGQMSVRDGWGCGVTCRLTRAVSRW